MLHWQYIALKGNLMWRGHSSDRPWTSSVSKPLADIDTLQMTHWPKWALFRSWQGYIDHFCFFFIVRGNNLVVTLFAWMAYPLKVSLEPLQPPPKRPRYSEACARPPYLPPLTWPLEIDRRHVQSHRNTHRISPLILNHSADILFPFCLQRRTVNI